MQPRLTGDRQADKIQLGGSKYEIWLPILELHNIMIFSDNYCSVAFKPGAQQPKALF